jgi:hypothetical protein
MSEHSRQERPGLSAGARFRASPDVIAQRVGDEVVVVHLTTNRMYELNATAACLWELLTAGHDVGAIRERMLREFDVDADRLWGEIEGTLASMRDVELVQAVEPA